MSEFVLGFRNRDMLRLSIEMVNLLEMEQRRSMEVLLSTRSPLRQQNPKDNKTRKWDMIRANIVLVKVLVDLFWVALYSQILLRANTRACHGRSMLEAKVLCETPSSGHTGSSSEQALLRGKSAAVDS